MTSTPSRFTDLARRRAASTAGGALLLMALLAPFAQFFVLQNVVVPGDATATAANVLTSEGAFRGAIAALLIVAMLDVVVAWALYVVLEPVHEALALLAAWFRLAYAAVFALAVADLANALQSLRGTVPSEADTSAAVAVQATAWLDSFGAGWNAGLALFGLHLFGVGFLVFVSGFLPRFLGVLVVLAGGGYVLDSFGTVLLADYGLGVSTYTFVGEALLMIWLLWIGVRGRAMRPARRGAAPEGGAVPR